MSALPPKADIAKSDCYVCFSNRSVGVKRFQTIHHHVATSLAGSCFSTESAHGPLYGAF
jgi:hypothetical protein